MMFSKVNLMLHQLVKVCFNVFHNDTHLTKIIVLFDLPLSKRLSIYLCLSIRTYNIYKLWNKTVVSKELFINFVKVSHQL